MAANPFDSRRRRSGIIRRCGQGARVCLRLSTAVLLLALLAGGVLWGRLQQGPLPIPGIAEIVAEQVNRRIEGSTVRVGGAEISLGSVSAPAGLRFLDVTVHAPDGQLLMAAPKLAARFSPADLILGRIQPTRISLIGAQARIMRGMDGRIRFGLGSGPGIVFGPEPETAPVEEETAGADAIAEILASFVGDAPPLPVLERLNAVEVLRADLTYADARTGRSWRTRGSDLRVLRTGEGARATMRAAIGTGAGAQSTRLIVSATRKRGTGQTDISVRTRQLDIGDLAEQVAALAPLGAVDAMLDGVLRVSVLADGRLGALSGRLTAGAGSVAGAALSGDGGPLNFERAHLAFTGETASRGLRIDALEVESGPLDIALSGHASFVGADPLRPEAADIMLELGPIRVEDPAVFKGPIAFEGGQLVARLMPEEVRLDLVSLHLEKEDLTLSATGQMRAGAEGPTVDLHTTGTGLTVAGLKAHWPIPAAANARAWVVEHLVSGAIPELVGQFRFGPGEPEVNLDFRFTDLTSRYLGAMSPIVEAAGTGHLTLDDFRLGLETGAVAPGGQAIRLDGSHVHISDLWGEVTWGDITVLGDGPLGAILGLIDEQPLGLVGKLGLDPSTISGTAAVDTTIRLPLLAALKLEEVDVAAEADLADVALALPGGQGTATAQRLALSADTSAMRIAGRVRAEGVPLDVVWRERYGAGPGGRSLEVSGALTPEFLAARGVALDAFRAGRAPVSFTLEASGDQADFTADMDLAEATLGLEALRWEKPAGTPGRLSLTGRVAEDIQITEATLNAGDLAVAAQVSLSPAGALRSVTVPRFVLGDRADLALRVERAADGVLDVRVDGARLDLSEFITEPTDSETTGGTPFRLQAEIGALTLTPKLTVAPAKGFLIRTTEGATKLEFDGRAGGEAPFSATYARRSGEPALIELRSSDAGGLLGATGLFTGGRGGTLEVEARLKPEPGTDARGTVQIKDVTVRSDGTFGSILEEGGVSEAAEAVQDGGLAFDSIEIPFSYADGVMTLGSSIARSALLAIKVEGTLDEAADRIALGGVISPAYALTGALDEIPVLGALLSGGRGEGILAMTFRVNGTLDEPTFAVNPLSILTPGFLRGVFSGTGEAPDDGFLNQLGPTE